MSSIIFLMGNKNDGSELEAFVFVRAREFYCENDAKPGYEMTRDDLLVYSVVRRRDTG
jgi:hypothetical protein